MHAETADLEGMLHICEVVEIHNAVLCLAAAASLGPSNPGVCAVAVAFVGSKGALPSLRIGSK